MLESVVEKNGEGGSEGGDGQESKGYATSDKVFYARWMFGKDSKYCK